MTEIDYCKRIKISDLKRLNYLIPGKVRYGYLEWGSKSSVSVVVDMVSFQLTLEYRCNGEPVKYNVAIEERTSNLGFGKVYYFKWETASGLIFYCRKLYLCGKYFVPRVLMPNVMYSSQIESKMFRDILPGDNPYRKRGKTHYKGMITPYGKRLVRFYEKEELSESVLMSRILKPH